MATHEQASDEILQFLENLQADRSCLPDVVMEYWRNVIDICGSANPDWDRAESLCDHMKSTLIGLRNGDGDLRQMDKAQGLVSILLGAICLGRRDLPAAHSHFENGGQYLHSWQEKDCEGLAYLGRAFTHREEKNWPEALTMLQKALDANSKLPFRDQSKHTRRLKRRVEREIGCITMASKQNTTQIPIVDDIAAGLGVIVEENIEEYLLLDDNHRNGATFGVKVVGDSMKDDGILPGDIVLIREQKDAEIGEIIAVLITTKAGNEGVLKIYRYHQKHGELQHVLLESSNPHSEDLVVIPSGANVDSIRALYTSARQRAKILNPLEYYEDAQLKIAGKYVGLVRNT
ncbi:MAG: S24 family peptidase [Anaerolineae bacterium]|jgi:SOS-response transcriptional repressor LexA